MEDRQPYDLKYIMGTYNLFQVLACAYIIHGVSKKCLTYIFLTIITIVCI